MKTRSKAEKKQIIRKEEDKTLVTKISKKTKNNSRNKRKNKVSLFQKQNLTSLSLDFKKKNSNISTGNVDQKVLDLEDVKDIAPKDYGKPKSFTKHDTDAAKVTEWIDITILELSEILKEERKHHKDVEEEEICPICRCELYDNIFKLTKKQILKIQQTQIEDPSSIEVVKFKDCLNHFYHKDCTFGMISGEAEPSTPKLPKKKAAQYIKCSVCSIIYGEFIGDSPPGSMSWEYFSKGNLPIETFEKEGTWVVNYSFRNGVRKGVEYRGTQRTAYLPDTKEGREVLILLTKSFERKVTFTVGDSVTTGRSNVVVWNSIHHKTNTHGGTLTFGYPDPTYFNRVTLEIANKGLFLDEGDDVDNIPKKGTVFIC